MNHKTHFRQLALLLVISSIPMWFAIVVGDTKLKGLLVLLGVAIFLLTPIPLPFWVKRRSKANDSLANGRLVPDVFEGAAPNGWLGLCSGQMRISDPELPDTILVNDNPWFNGKGAYLGIGDLNAEDIARIVKELRGNEIFIILCESERSHSKAPGIEYVVENSNYVILPGQAYYVSHLASSPVSINQHGIVFNLMRKEALRLLMENLG